VGPSQGLGHLWEPVLQQELELAWKLELQSGPWPLAGKAYDLWPCRYQ
jgi:hypothetical protein